MLDGGALNARKCSLVIVAIASGLLMGGRRELKVSAAATDSMASFASISPIDAHIHVFAQSPALTAFLARYNLHMLDILVVDNRDPFFKDFASQMQKANSVLRGNPGRAALCTTFDPYDFEKAGFAQRVIAQLNSDFAAGAVAVKIYKTLGMQIQKKNGAYLMPDDPVFAPIYQDIAAHHRTVVAHLAEPTSAWLPPNRASPDYDYYQSHPEEYAYAHPKWPRKEAILAARDHLLEQNPNLRVVGAHLGSMELSVDEIAKRFDQYPNFAVDTAARVPYLMLQPRDKVRAFLIKYQTRVLYATDLEMMPESDTAKQLAAWKANYEMDWKYFSTSETVEYMGHKITGLALPAEVLRKLYHDNAVQWFPGILEERAPGK
jgi:predicted TIM-barrel fold metal-dependent hydrolase